MENVLTWEFFYELIFLKPVETDGTGSFAFLHDHCLYRFPLERLRNDRGIELILKGNDISGHGKIKIININNFLFMNLTPDKFNLYEHFRSQISCYYKKLTQQF